MQEQVAASHGQAPVNQPDIRQETVTESAVERSEDAEQQEVAEESEDRIAQPEKPVKKTRENHNKEILSLYEQGESAVEIAKKLGLGLGEVKLVIGLYKGELKL
jgi:DNA-directed RNA polymerase specialized sigma24 family protein